MTRRHIAIVRDDRPIVVGSGIAGLTAALSLEGSIVVTAARVGHGSSNLAQGGIAAAVGSDDRVEDHVADTLTVSGGIGDAAMASTIASEAPARIDWLRHLGATFDSQPDGALDLGREAGHSHRRIIHAGGDATGAEIMRTLRLATAMRVDIDLVAGSRLVDLIMAGDRVVGALTVSGDGTLVARVGSGVVLATGGIGGVYLRSTNPAEVTGVGLAAAARQGATLADLEFVQFHPTALTAVDHPAPLISEALRGEGAILVDETGTRFLTGAHPDAELAPRDVVSTAIWRHHTEGHRVFLDASTSIGQDLPVRFPTAFEAAMAVGVDPRTEPMPVLPAEHFHMGGIATDANGMTSLPGLWAAGEVACTGAHGANRLASNSLLEAAVMGQRVARSITETKHGDVASDALTIPASALPRCDAGLERDDDRVRRLMWTHVGIVRDAPGLAACIASLDADEGTPTDAMTVARLIAVAALERNESRGAHQRSDYPSPDPGMAMRSTTRPKPVDRMALTGAAALAS